MSKKIKLDYSEKAPFSITNNFNSVVMENEMTGALPTPSDEALETYEQAHHEYFNFPLGVGDRDQKEKK